MKKLNFNTKQAQNFIKAYNNSSNMILQDCYKSFSNEKYQAYRKCLGQAFNESGKKFRIISANSFQFTVAWMKENTLRIVTRNNDYYIELPF